MTRTFNSCGEVAVSCSVWPIHACKLLRQLHLKLSKQHKEETSRWASKHVY